MTDRPTDPMEWVPAAAGGICVAVLDDQAVLYDTDSARPVLLNITASAVWAEIDGQRTVAQISGELARRFGAADRVDRGVADVVHGDDDEPVAREELGEERGDVAESTAAVGVHHEREGSVGAHGDVRECGLGGELDARQERVHRRLTGGAGIRGVPDVGDQGPTTRRVLELERGASHRVLARLVGWCELLGHRRGGAGRRRILAGVVATRGAGAGEQGTREEQRDDGDTSPRTS